MSPVNPSKGSTFCTGKGFSIRLAYRFSHDQTHADFSCNIIRPLALGILNHSHIPKSAISFQHLDFLTDCFLSIQCPVLPSVSSSTLRHPKSVSATLKVWLNVILRSFHTSTVVYHDASVTFCALHISFSLYCP